MDDIRSNSVSKHAQQLLPRFNIRPREVRLLVGHSFPRLRASSTDEKKGKSASTKGAQLVSVRIGRVSSSLDWTGSNGVSRQSRRQKIDFSGMSHESGWFDEWLHSLL